MLDHNDAIQDTLRNSTLDCSNIETQPFDSQCSPPSVSESNCDNIKIAYLLGFDFEFEFVF